MNRQGGEENGGEADWEEAAGKAAERLQKGLFVNQKGYFAIGFVFEKRLENGINTKSYSQIRQLKGAVFHLSVNLPAWFHLPV